MIAEFYIVLKRRLEIKAEADLPVIRPAAVICLIIGVAASFAFQNMPGVPVPAFLTVVVTGLAHVILRLGCKMS